MNHGTREMPSKLHCSGGRVARDAQELQPTRLPLQEIHFAGADNARVVMRLLKRIRETVVDAGFLRESRGYPRYAGPERARYALASTR